MTYQRFWCGRRIRWHGKTEALLVVMDKHSPNLIETGTEICTKSEIDIKAFFDNVSHELILKALVHHKGLEQFFFTGSKKGIKPDHSSRLARLLDRLNAATEIKDMNYPGSFLHQLTGDKEGQFSVRVSGNWRVFFEFKDGDAYIVDYGDYH